ncbi:MAG: GNAT family N-acetyltransferase [Polyangiaceae bacterium]|nr:GNAT family N-acetyltransferase [Polyangiaceae bacterium]
MRPAALEEVVLEPVSRRHTAAIQAMASDPEVAGTTGLPSPYPTDGAARFVGLALQGRAQGSGYHLVILVRRRCVGVCGVKNIDPTGRAGEIGYWIGRAYWGRGIATRAVMALCEVARTELGLRTLSAWSLEKNTASIRVLEKCGFCRTRRERNAHRLVHRPPDEYLVFYARSLEQQSG